MTQIEILKIFASHNIFPFQINKNSNNFLLMKTKDNLQGIPDINTNNVQEYFFSPKINYEQQNITINTYQFLIPIISDKNFKIHSEYSKFFGCDNIFSFIKTSTDYYFKLSLYSAIINLLFNNSTNYDSINILIKLDILSKNHYQNLNSHILDLLTTKKFKIENIDYIKIAKQISKNNNLLTKKIEIDKLLHFFSNHNNAIDLICDKNILFKQYMTNLDNTSFYFIDEYYNDKNIGFIDINIKKICESSFNNLEKHILPIFYKSVNLVANLYLCNSILSEKNNRLLVDEKNNKNKKIMKKNSNLTIVYISSDKENLEKFRSFLKILLENSLSQLYEFQHNNPNLLTHNFQDFIQNMCKKNIDIMFEKQILEIEIPKNTKAVKSLVNKF